MIDVVVVEEVRKKSPRCKADGTKKRSKQKTPPRSVAKHIISLFNYLMSDRHVTLKPKRPRALALRDERPFCFLYSFTTVALKQHKTFRSKNSYASPVCVSRLLVSEI